MFSADFRPAHRAGRAVVITRIRYQPLAIGFALAAGVLLGGPVNGGAGNPARALGPMIVAGAFADWYLYVVGPIVGGVIAAVLYHRFIAQANAPTTAVADAPVETAARSAAISA